LREKKLWTHATEARDTVAGQTTLLLWKWSWQPLSNSGSEMGILNVRNGSDQRESIHSRREVGTVARDV